MLGAPSRQRSGGAVVNDMPVACQSRAVTEPQREKAHLKYNKPPSKSFDINDFWSEAAF